MNPLQQYFRQPSIYISLPSKGDFYPDTALEKTDNGEYPVLPMTTIDEITYRTPDAIFNGNAVVSVIQSCLPNIKDAWAMPSIDIDTALVGIRLATYGHELDINTTCTSCENTDEYTIDLRNVLENIKPGDYTKPIQLGELEIYIKPMTYKDMNNNSLAQFEEQKVIQMLQGTEEMADEEKIHRLGDALKKITQVTTTAIAQNISKVVHSGGEVIDTAHINEWLQNSDKNTFEKIRHFVLSNKEGSEIKPVQITCDECGHEYEQPFTLDMSNFFADAS
jgi:hypothetical protein